MRRRLTKAHLRLLGAMVFGITAVGVIVDFFEIGWPLKIGALVVALAVAYWSLQPNLPEVRDALLVMAVAVAASLAWTQFESRNEGKGNYDFIVVPQKVIATESAFPGPDREASDSSFYRYGDHVEVTCHLIGYDDREWLALADGNFIARGELEPSPLEDGSPPRC